MRGTGSLQVPLISGRPLRQPQVPSSRAETTTTCRRLRSSTVRDRTTRPVRSSLSWASRRDGTYRTDLSHFPARGDRTQPGLRALARFDRTCLH
eukprot:602469-Hanusia_phi.AAC.2